MHWAVERRLGRLFVSKMLNTRISSGRWDPVPVPPADAAAKIAPIPLLIVHGDQDSFFPVEHATQLYVAANEPKRSGGSARVLGTPRSAAAADTALLDRIGGWVSAAVVAPASTTSIGQ